MTPGCTGIAENIKIVNENKLTRKITSHKTNYTNIEKKYDESLCAHDIIVDGKLTSFEIILTKVCKNVFHNYKYISNTYRVALLLKILINKYYCA